MTDRENPAVISFRPGIALRENFRNRQRKGEPLSSRIQEDLGRYYALIEGELLTLNLTVSEACFLCDIYNGILSDFRLCPRQTLYGNAYSALEGAYESLDYCEKWGFDGETLLKKLLAFSNSQAAAVIDATEQFWAREREDCRSTQEIVTEIFKISN